MQLKYSSSIIALSIVFTADYLESQKELDFYQTCRFLLNMRITCRLKVCCLSTLLLIFIMPHPSLGKLLSIHVHSVQTIPRSAFPRSNLPGVPYQVAALHEPCAILLQLHGLNTTVPVVPPDTGFPRASFRDNGGGACPAAANVCSQPFVVSFEVSVVMTLSEEELPTLHIAQQLLHSSEPNIAFFYDPPNGHSSLVSPRLLSSHRPNIQSLQYSVKSMTSGCGSLQLQLHFVTDGRLEHTTETFIISVPTWGNKDFDFHLLQENAAAISSAAFFDLSQQPVQCQPVNWDMVEQLSDHRALVAAVELPSPFAIAFVPMMAVPPFESRSALRLSI